MSESKHPLAGGLFLAVAVGLIGFGAYSGLGAGGHSAKADESAGEAVLNDRILSAIQLGQSGDVDAAAVQLKAVVAEHPNNLDALYNLGVALVGTGEVAEAERTFKKVLELSPGDGDALAELAGLKKDAGDLDGAFKLLDQISTGDSKISQRLLEDPLWVELVEDERMKGLFTKHGVQRRESDAEPPAGDPIR